MNDASYGQQLTWEPAAPRLRVLPVLVSWIVSAASRSRPTPG